MAYREIPKPPVLMGDDEAKWEQIRRYLWQLAEQLEQIINNIAEEATDNGQ